MRLKDHALSLVFAAAFLLSLAGQSIAGLVVLTEDQQTHGAPTSNWFDFVTSSDFIVDVAENWQSEYIQFFLFYPRDRVAGAARVTRVEEARQ